MENIDINVLFFGSLKPIYGNQMNLSIPRGLQLAAFIAKLKEMSPEATELLDSCRIAIDCELKNDDFAIDKSYELAVLPPYSGG